jgi:hypothetical protein
MTIIYFDFNNGGHVVYYGNIINDVTACIWIVPNTVIA